MSYEQATKEFRRARRRATVERLLAWLGGRSADLLCYKEVRDRLRVEASRQLGVQEIPLQSIVGSVERCDDYKRGFMPLKEGDQRRWADVMDAASAAWELPPICVYRVGEIHFVADGHHRVSVARQRGMTNIQAQVIEIETGGRLAAETSAGDAGRGLM